MFSIEIMLRPSGIASLLVAAVTSGCAMSPSLQSAIEVTPQANLEFLSPYVIDRSPGALVSGRLCQRTRAIAPPHLVRIEHLDGEGGIRDSVTVHVKGLSDRCPSYRAQTNWRLSGGDRIRLCADPRSLTCTQSGR
jgi:hypothetical protein